jgi:two-component system LytT family response regulator
VRLAEALARARALRVAPARERARVQDASAAVAAAAARPVARLLARDARGAPSLVDVARIVLARAQRNYVALHGEDATWRLRGTIGALEARLDPTAFVRVNRSDIVREAAIVALEPWAHGDWRVTLSAGRSLLWSRRYRARDAARFDAVAGRLPRGRR